MSQGKGRIGRGRRLRAAEWMEGKEWRRLVCEWHRMCTGRDPSGQERIGTGVGTDRIGDRPYHGNRNKGSSIWQMDSMEVVNVSRKWKIETGKQIW